MKRIGQLLEAIAAPDNLRFARKFRRYERAWLDGQWSELHLQQRM